MRLVPGAAGRAGHGAARAGHGAGRAGHGAGRPVGCALTSPSSFPRPTADEQPLHGTPLAAWTTLGVGGEAAELLVARERDQLCEAVARADAQGRPVLLLGGGSNVVVGDGGFDGLVVRVGVEGEREQEDGDGSVLVRVGAGVSWDDFVRRCLAEGLAGVECLVGVPGLVGATPVQNVGAYGQEVAEVVEAVQAWDRARGQLVVLQARECAFGYRDSLFKRSDRYVVTEVVFRLTRSGTAKPLRYPELARALGAVVGDRPPCSEVAAAVLALRRSKGMVIGPGEQASRSVGSFFVNPVLGEAEVRLLDRRFPGAPRFPAPGGTKVPAAWLVEACGFHKGYRRGRAAVSSRHALALVALDGARAADVVDLAREVRDGVAGRTGVVLQPEPRLVGCQL